MTSAVGKGEAATGAASGRDRDVKVREEQGRPGLEGLVRRRLGFGAQGAERRPGAPNVKQGS